MWMCSSQCSQHDCVVPSALKQDCPHLWQPSSRGTFCLCSLLLLRRAALRQHVQPQQLGRGRPRRQNRLFLAGQRLADGRQQREGQLAPRLAATPALL